MQERPSRGRVGGSTEAALWAQVEATVRQKLGGVGGPGASRSSLSSSPRPEPAAGRGQRKAAGGAASGATE